MPVKKLETIDADTLLGIPYEPPAFVVEDLLPQGLHLLAGAPKIGKSWLALWLCLRVAQGQPLWDFATRPCEVLYLCLEDSFQRIKNRLFDLTEDAPPALHFAVMAEQLRSGLVEQIEQFLREHPATGLVVIDTLQSIRGAGSEVNSYASDYQDIGVLKALADRHRIAGLTGPPPAEAERRRPHQLSVGDCRDDLHGHHRLLHQRRGRCGEQYHQYSTKTVMIPSPARRNSSLF